MSDLPLAPFQLSAVGSLASHDGVSAARSEDAVAPPEASTQKISPVHGLLSHATLLPILLTAATFLISFLFQVYQQHSQLVSAEDSEWRKALEHVAAKDSATAALGAYEMQSFLDTRHGAKARSIAITLLPQVDNHAIFDLILYDVLPGVNQSNQQQIVAVDRLIAGQLHDSYRDLLRDTARTKPLPTDTSFAHFLTDPAAFYEDESESEQLGRTLERTWELDSVSNALSSMWSQKKLWSRLTPHGEDLDDIVLLNNDFRSVDFKASRSMNGATFYGSCLVEKSKLLPGASVECQR